MRFCKSTTRYKAAQRTDPSLWWCCRQTIFFQTVETSEFWVGGFLLVITSRASMLPSRSENSSAIGSIAHSAGASVHTVLSLFRYRLLNRVGKGFGVGHQLRGFRHDNALYAVIAPPRLNSASLCAAPPLPHL